MKTSQIFNKYFKNYDFLYIITLKKENIILRPNNQILLVFKSKLGHIVNRNREVEADISNQVMHINRIKFGKEKKFS